MLTAAASAAAVDFLPLDLCRGSRRPYPAPAELAAVPDSLTPVMINHVSRHGARYATSPKRFLEVEAALQAHEDALTPRGKRLLDITRRAIELSQDSWGQLDSLGRAEQMGIAARLCNAYPQLVVGREVKAISSYVERCVESMDAFTSVVRRFQSGTGSVTDSAGRCFSPLLRPFETDTAYVRWAREKPYETVLKPFDRKVSPGRDMLSRLMSKEDAAQFSDSKAEDLCGSIYYVVSSLAAMGLADADSAMELLTPEEYNTLWEIDNLRQYLSRTATTVSTLPAEIAAPLLLNLIETTDNFIAGREKSPLLLRFGHAETLMPLLSLMRLPGCYYLTHYFDTVAAHWQTYHVVPMASNLQLLILRSTTGRHYVRVELNERPLTLPGHGTIIPWPVFRARLLALAPTL